MLSQLEDFIYYIKDTERGDWTPAAKEKFIEIKNIIDNLLEV